MAKPIITFIGLGTVGTSLGLALQQSGTQADVIGHDKLPEVAQAARKANAVQRVEWNLHAACEKASLIVLAVPLSEVDETLDLIREDLIPDALVLVVTDVLQPAAAMLANRLPAHAHTVVGHPILSGVGGTVNARADLFDHSVFVLAASAQANPSALELASNFVETLGAQPLFMDALEHDGIMAGVEQLPRLLGAALVHLLVSSPGWAEAKRLAGRTFAQSTDLGKSAEHLYVAFHANRANLLPRIEQFERELAAWKAWLATPAVEGAEPPLQAALIDTVQQRITWEAQALLKNWDPTPVQETESQPSTGLFRQLFLGNLGGKKSEKH